MTRGARSHPGTHGRLERQVAWYPGHMAKAARRIRELLQTIDVVVEVVDARIVRSGRNPLLEELAARRTRVLAFTRSRSGRSQR